MAHYRNGHEIRHPAPGPEASDGRKTAKTNANRPPGTDSTTKGAASKGGGFVPCDYSCPSPAIPGTLAAQVTKPAA